MGFFFPLIKLESSAFLCDKAPVPYTRLFIPHLQDGYIYSSLRNPWLCWYLSCVTLLMLDVLSFILQEAFNPINDISLRSQGFHFSFLSAVRYCLCLLWDHNSWLPPVFLFSFTWLELLLKSLLVFLIFMMPYCEAFSWLFCDMFYPGSPIVSWESISLSFSYCCAFSRCTWGRRASDLLALSWPPFYISGEALLPSVQWVHFRSPDFSV